MHLVRPGKYVSLMEMLSREAISADLPARTKAISEPPGNLDCNRSTSSNCHTNNSLGITVTGRTESDRKNWSMNTPNKQSPSRHQITTLFTIADALFLILVGGAANVAMVFVHSLDWGCVTTWLTGMVAAMIAQITLATIATPILGSIETMVPSMVVGMVVPMQVCLFEAFGGRFTYRDAAAFGAASGLLVFTILSLWARRHRPMLPTADRNELHHGS